MRAHSMRNNNQILYGDQTRYEANFYTVDHDHMTRDLFALANLLLCYNFNNSLQVSIRFNLAGSCSL